MSCSNRDASELTEVEGADVVVVIGGGGRGGVASPAVTTGTFFPVGSSLTLAGLLLMVGMSDACSFPSGHSVEPSHAASCLDQSVVGGRTLAHRC